MDRFDKGLGSLEIEGDQGAGSRDQCTGSRRASGDLPIPTAQSGNCLGGLLDELPPGICSTQLTQYGAGACLGSNPIRFVERTCLNRCLFANSSAYFASVSTYRSASSWSFS
jgi:hypothetical protein